MHLVLQSLPFMQRGNPAKLRWLGDRPARHAAGDKSLPPPPGVEDDMLDHDQITAPQFEADMEAVPRTAPEGPRAPAQAGAAPRLDTWMLLPFQIAMALPAAVIAQGNSSAILRQLSWQRERARR